MYLNAVKDFMIEKLEKELPGNLYFHNVQNIIAVYKLVKDISRNEKLSGGNLMLLKTAAIFHDAGYLSNYENHEEESCSMAHSILPEYGYRKVEVDAVCRMIMATKDPRQPKNLLEEILCDADTDYLGRAEYFELSQNLYLERKAYNVLDENIDWIQQQAEYFAQHTYFTKTQQMWRDPNKQINFTKLKEMALGERV